jgi:hypothetical protein
MECSDIIHRAVAAYGRRWTGRIHHGGGTTNARGGATRINLPKWARTKDIVLHEAAHAIMALRFPGYAAHGPEYARVWMNLLEAEGVVKAPEFRKAAREAHVKVSTNAKFDRVPARALKEHQQIVARLQAAEAELEAARIAHRESRKRIGI